MVINPQDNATSSMSMVLEYPHAGHTKDGPDVMATGPRRKMATTKATSWVKGVSVEGCVCDYDAVLPIPPDCWKQRQRGFQQRAPPRSISVPL